MNAMSPKWVNLLGKWSSPYQLFVLNASLPICFKLLGNKSSQVKEHNSKALNPIVSNVEGKCKTPVREEQAVNAWSLISFTPSGICKEPVRDVQFQNAADAIPMSFSGKTKCIRVFFPFIASVGSTSSLLVLSYLLALIFTSFKFSDCNLLISSLMK